jgi:hypothetical protein
LETLELMKSLPRTEIGSAGASQQKRIFDRRGRNFQRQINLLADAWALCDNSGQRPVPGVQRNNA